MADDDQRAVIGVERRLQGFNRVEIKVVAWFVQNQELCGLAVPKGASQPGAQPLTTAERGNALQRVVAAKQEPRKDRTAVVFRRSRIQSRKGVRDGFIGMKQHHVLIQPRGGYMHCHVPRRGIQVTGDDGQKRGFP